MNTRTAVLTLQAQQGKGITQSLFWLSFNGPLSEHTIRLGITEWCKQQASSGYIDPNKVCILNIFICES